MKVFYMTGIPGIKYTERNGKYTLYRFDAGQAVRIGPVFEHRCDMLAYLHAFADNAVTE